MDPIFILVAFLGGLAALPLRLPPLVGFLAAGFVLNVMGYELTPTLSTIADLGVTLLLFSIGLKLNVRSLLRGEVWGAASLHMAASIGLLFVILTGLKLLGITLLQGTETGVMLILAFALSFSSTVFAVKVLEDRSETQTLYGRIAIGVLIMQDIFAVIFLTASTGQLPSPWALLLLALIPAAPLLRGLMNRVGHGDMEMLFGFTLALVIGYQLFELVGVKGDLGALIIGILLAPHFAAQRLARALFNTKELLLVGFFLSIGLTALPTWEHFGIAAILLVLLPLKALLFAGLFAGFRLRDRTTALATLALANYSEFGLIVVALSASQGWLPADWLVVLSLSVAMSFVLSAILNSQNEAIYRRLRRFIPQTSDERLHSEDSPINLGDATAVVLGMGKIGRGAYLQLEQRYGKRVLGIDNKHSTVERLSEQGFRVREGDAVDSDFWDKLLVSPDVKLVLLAMPHHAGNLFALDQLRGRKFDGRIAAIVEYEDEAQPLLSRGANAVFNVYDKAGVALADSAMEAKLMQYPQGDTSGSGV